MTFFFCVGGNTLASTFENSCSFVNVSVALLLTTFAGVAKEYGISIVKDMKDDRIIVARAVGPASRPRWPDFHLLEGPLSTGIRIEKDRNSIGQVVDSR